MGMKVRLSIMCDGSKRLPTMILFHLLALYLVSSTVRASKSLDEQQPKLPNQEEATAKGYQLLLGADKDKLSDTPNFFKSYGKLGVNYNITTNGIPFIWCEKTNSSCDGPLEECVHNVQCFPERRSHLLGCMVAIVYNISETTPHARYSLPPNALMIKGCWSHYDSVLEECLHESECISQDRSTGLIARTAKFCCCRTHFCNQNITLKAAKLDNNSEERITGSTTSTSFSAGDIYLMPQILFESTILILITVILFIICLGITSIFSFWLVMKRKRRHTEETQLKEMNPSDKNSSYLETTTECEALLGAKMTSLKNAKFCEVLSNGQFSQVYRAEVESVFVAIRIYNLENSEGWINEHEIFGIKGLRAHENIVDFLASLRIKKQLWVVCKYYYNGSVFDYLGNNKLTIHEACKILSSMLTGLAFLHEEFYVDGELKHSVVHRDFKSRNVMLKSDLTACIRDFDISVKCENGKIENEDNQSQVGTRRYMSPEVLEGATDFSGFAFQQIDVYAAGLVVWEILTRTCVPEHPDEILPEYALPYEREIGKTPTLGRLRELVVLRKFRPLCRETLLDNMILEKLVRTMRDMWDGEPDGRITSSCARDRMNHYFNVSVGKCQFNEPAPVHYHGISENSSTCSVQTRGPDQGAISSFECLSATGTTSPIARLTTSTPSSFTD